MHTSSSSGAATLIARPFNDLSRRSALPEADMLWQRATALFAEQHAEFTSGQYPPALRDFYGRRYGYGGWTPETLSKARGHFLTEAGHQYFHSHHNGRVRERGWLVFDADQQPVGEFVLWHSSQNPHLARGLDTLRPSRRGQGLGMSLLELELKTAAGLGYEKYMATIRHGNEASMQRLEKLAQTETARRGEDYYVNGKNFGRTYWIDLAKFKMG